MPLLQSCSFYAQCMYTACHNKSAVFFFLLIFHWAQDIQPTDKRYRTEREIKTENAQNKRDYCQIRTIRIPPYSYTSLRFIVAGLKALLLLLLPPSCPAAAKSYGSVPPTTRFVSACCCCCNAAEVEAALEDGLLLLYPYSTPPDSPA